ncbi:MAG: hypothetical protein R2713_06730 [Ilumatobacteraceae bacterium]
MSMIIMASVVSDLPYSYYSILQSRSGSCSASSPCSASASWSPSCASSSPSGASRCSYLKRVVGRRMCGGQNTYIPLKVNQSGIVPIIFASSVLLLPVLLSNMLGSGEGWRGSVVDFVDEYIVNSQNIDGRITAVLAADRGIRLLLQRHPFDPIRQADQLRRQGGFIPTVRVPQTERYLASRQPGLCPVRCSSRSAIPAVSVAVGRRRAELPLRRNHRADRGRCSSRTDAPDRQPAHVAQLRGLPQVIPARSRDVGVQVG